MVLGKLQVPGRPTNFDCSRAKANALAVASGGGCLDVFSRLWEVVGWCDDHG